MFYRREGNIPPKRHTQHKDKSGSLYFEELISREGFSSIYSNVYHLNMPTEILEIGNFTPIEASSKTSKHKNRHFRTAELEKRGDLISGRKLLLYNDDLFISKLHISKSASYLYRNSHFDELLYIQSGKGILLTNFGNLDINKGDYIVIPRGVIWKIELELDINALVLESKGSIRTPSRYRNKFGQLMEHSPFCERDIVTPNLLDPIIQEAVEIKVRLNDGFQNYLLGNHPFDIVGWDGYYYPWKFNINDFEPITGSIHQPPPVHQTFAGDGFVVCSFVSRHFDYHPDSIPAPYPHSNVDSDEVIFYSMGDFMSRKGISDESISFHPAGITHGPQPGKYEESIGKVKTEELAVMIDTFKPLKVAKGLETIEDKSYWKSWLK